MSNIRFALPNIFNQDAERLADFAYEHSFTGIDWSLSLDLPRQDFAERIGRLKDFELRYHCRFYGIDLAYADQRAEQSMDIFKRIVRMVSDIGGGQITVHIGLGHNSVEELDWEKGIENLAALVSFGSDHGVTVCLENLTTVWTSQPELFESLVKESRAGVTFDIGHAHVCQKDRPEVDLCEQYVLPHKERIFNAHIYHTEIPWLGHLAPKSLEDIADRLEVLKTATPCDWWVIELAEPDEILRTRDFLERYVQENHFERQSLLKMGI